MQAQALSEYQARRARLGMIPPPRSVPVQPSLPPPASVYADEPKDEPKWRTWYDEPAGPPELESSFERATFIVNGISHFYGFTPMELKSERREEEIIKPRFEAIYLIRMFTPWSLPRIGRFFGNRDHTSIRYAVIRHKAYLEGKEYRIYPVATKRGARVPVDQADRENILRRRAAGEPLKQIALEMGRAVSTVQGVIAKAQSREIEKSDHVNRAGN